MLNGPILSHPTACVLDSQRDWRAASSACPLVSQIRDPEYKFFVLVKTLSSTEQTAEVCCVSEPNLSHWLYMWAYTRGSEPHTGHSRRIPLGYIPHGEPPKGWENDSPLSDCNEEVPPGMYLSYIAAMLWPIPASCRPVCSRVHQRSSVLDVQ